MEKQSDAFDYSRHVKAEILMYQQSRATPYELEYITSVKPCKGVIRISPLRGFHRVANPTNRALPSHVRKILVNGGKRAGDFS